MKLTSFLGIVATAFFAATSCASAIDIDILRVNDPDGASGGHAA